MKRIIRLFDSYISPTTPKAVRKVIESGKVNRGEQAKIFERMFCQMFGYEHALSVNSCTSALRMAFDIVKCKWQEIKKEPPFEVITTPWTMVATNTAILECGMKPVFADIQYDTGNINPNSVREKLTPNTVAIVGVDYAGYPCDWDELLQVMAENPYNQMVYLIEDAAQALGARMQHAQYHRDYIGKIADMTCFSFQAIKHITSLDYTEPIILMTLTNEIIIEQIGKFIEENWKNFNGWKCLSSSTNGKLDFVNITNLIKHPIDEDLYEIRTMPSKFIKVTGSHSLFTIKSKKIVDVKVSDLKIGDYVLVANNIPNIESYDLVSLELAELLGWYIAEGSLNKTKNHNYFIIFSLSFKEKREALRIKELQKSLFDINARIYKQKSCLRVISSSKFLYKLLEMECGKGAKNKHFPSIIFSCPNKIKKLIVKTIHKGDGYYREINGKHKSFQYKITTVSKKLSDDLFYLLLQIGINPRITIRPPSERDFGKYISHTLQAYDIHWNNKSIVTSKGFRNSSKKGKKKYNDLSLVKIVSITKVSPTKNFVYDLEVKGYENFVGGHGFLAHNTGDGGMFVTQSNFLDWIAKQKIWFGIDKEKREKSPLGDYPRDIEYLGFKYGMNDIAAMMGIEGLKDLTFILEKRRRIARQYREELAGVNGLTLMEYNDDRESANWMFPIHIERRLRFAEQMREKGIEVSVHNWRNDKYSIFCGLQNLPNTEKLNSDILHIPLHMSLSQENVEYI